MVLLGKEYLWDRGGIGSTRGASLALFFELRFEAWEKYR